MCVKERYRKRFHSFKELNSEPLHGSLSHIYHDPVVRVCADDSQHKYKTKPQHPVGERSIIRRALFHHRFNIYIDKFLHEHRYTQYCKCRYKYADHNRNACQLVFLENISEQPAKSLHRILSWILFHIIFLHLLICIRIFSHFISTVFIQIFRHFTSSFHAIIFNSSSHQNLRHQTSGRRRSPYISCYS